MVPLLDGNAGYIAQVWSKKDFFYMLDVYWLAIEYEYLKQIR